MYVNGYTKKYSQIDKEAYSIIFGIKKFRQYLYGNKFILYTDHRPLVHIFAPTKNLPVYSAMRMQHYALFLRGFNYSIKYKNTKLHSNADCLSRLPITKLERCEYDVVDAFQLDTIQTLPVTFEELVTATKQYTQLREILQALQDGKKINKNKAHNEEFEYSLQQGVILRGHRVIIPKVLQKRILRELHNVHFGIIKMKMLARSYVWWSGIDQDIEQITKNCAECNANKNNPTKVKHMWEQATFPFERVHIDFAGPFKGYNFLILVDAYTKWPEVHIVNNITAETTIMKCREIFSRFGLPV